MLKSYKTETLSQTVKHSISIIVLPARRFLVFLRMYSQSYLDTWNASLSTTENNKYPAVTIFYSLSVQLHTQ
jgi:hypothetical protein